jgi:2-methylisocitrate lyase-like PEP mutase family enzyme
MESGAVASKAEALLKLHQGPPILVLVNVWDVASARLAERAGFPAVATSSAAIANSLGYPDGQRISREEMLQVVARIVAKTAVPVSADLEAAYGDEDGTARGLVEAGAVGLNFEDGTGDPARPLAELADQCDRIKRMRATGEKVGVHIVINARTDVFLRQVGESATRFERAASRLNAYREAGADCLFAPGVQDRETIGRLVGAVKGPLNILAGPATPSVRELEQLGVARVSFGSWPARAAWGLFRCLTRELREKGTFTSIAEGAIPYAEMSQLIK